MDFESYATEQFESLQSKLEKLEAIKSAPPPQAENFWGNTLRIMGVVILFSGIVIIAIATLIKRESKRMGENQEFVMSSLTPSLATLNSMVPDINAIKQYVFGAKQQPTPTTEPTPTPTPAPTKGPSESVIYVPVLDDFYNGHGTLQGTSLFENMFTLASPHPTVDDNIPPPDCQKFNLVNQSVTEAVTEAIKSMPAFAGYTIRVDRMDASPAFTEDEKGALVYFTFADGGGVVGKTRVRASVREVGCNQWEVTAIGTGGGTDFCKAYKTQTLDRC